MTSSTTASPLRATPPRPARRDNRRNSLPCPPPCNANHSAFMEGFSFRICKYIVLLLRLLPRKECHLKVTPFWQQSASIPTLSALMVPISSGRMKSVARTCALEITRLTPVTLSFTVSSPFQYVSLQLLLIQISLVILIV